MFTLNNRKFALNLGFFFAIKEGKRWTFFQCLEDLEEYITNGEIEKPKAFDVKTGKRILA